ncbi:MAG: helix-turn-helix transcriptional regulator [Lachnospiraceae bacterium]|nr:helix-turn-helix transcriptional regulator [Lachnospiraceae bacterium]
MTQCDLAEAADLSVSYISQIESGRKEAGLGGLKRIAEALGIPMVLLLQTEEHPFISARSMQLVKELESCTSQELDIIWEVVLCLKNALQRDRKMQ